MEILSRFRTKNVANVTKQHGCSIHSLSPSLVFLFSTSCRHWERTNIKESTTAEPKAKTRQQSPPMKFRNSQKTFLFSRKAIKNALNKFFSLITNDFFFKKHQSQNKFYSYDKWKRCFKVKVNHFFTLFGLPLLYFTYHLSYNCLLILILSL